MRLGPEPTLAMAGFTTVWSLETAIALCDPVRLRQATLALIENARTHATPGPLKVETGIAAGRAWVRVEDSGPGLVAGLEARIFDPFQRDSTATTGSGLGLAVVRVIAEAHDGVADYRPGPSGGSAFQLSVPLRAV